MSLEGRLEDLGLADIFQIISLSKRSGVLTIIRKEGTGRLVFNRGMLIYGSSDSVSRLGYTLVKKGLVTTEELEKALRLQKTGGMKLPVGAILEKTGAIAKGVLEEELRNHLVEVVRDFLNWESGSFHFELGDPVANDLTLEEGLNLDFLMMEASRRQDEYERTQAEQQNTLPPAPENEASGAEATVPPGGTSEGGLPSLEDSQGAAANAPEKTTYRKDLALLTSMIEELSGPASGSEITLLVLRFASEVMNRAIIFLVRSDDILGLGQFGLQVRDESADEKIREVQIPLNEPSLFREVIAKKSSYKGGLAQEKWHRYFLDQIGGGWPKEVFLAPLLNGSEVIALLYGDNLPHQTPIPETEGLEAFVRVAGFAFGKAKLERKLQETKQKGPG
ncbi:DUF4388 domain-containing protein [Candidatus Manganitrophus noduliformans]|uniref:DUF4388 domain-containing protein n=1 Tax=Candidatus Manganitrophus noduliformans TaxID=2606439 RepID=A0A7X6DRZ7_9BACT|nr:DUF4388 domain-containing protein [Candidatus Manganitrophus noduliformans]NKE72302.1 DUF4388 domain-containing protein [Candidatus Manganitrophus noduliformans]